MCRIFGYLGQPIYLDRLIEKPEHSLIVQSYQPKELRTALLNADGFGLGWYHLRDRRALPYLYKNTLPIWNDINLPHLCRYVETHCAIANVRSATPGLAVDLSNCHPLQSRSPFVRPQRLHSGIPANLISAHAQPPQRCSLSIDSRHH